MLLMQGFQVLTTAGKLLDILTWCAGGSQSPFWVTTGQAGGANQPTLNPTPTPRFNPQVLSLQNHYWAVPSINLHACSFPYALQPAPSMLLEASTALAFRRCVNSRNTSLSRLHLNSYNSQVCLPIGRYLLRMS